MVNGVNIKIVVSFVGYFIIWYIEKYVYIIDEFK